MLSLVEYDDEFEISIENPLGRIESFRCPWAAFEGVKLQFSKFSLQNQERIPNPMEDATDREALISLRNLLDEMISMMVAEVRSIDMMIEEAGDGSPETDRRTETAD